MITVPIWDYAAIGSNGYVLWWFGGIISSSLDILWFQILRSSKCRFLSGDPYQKPERTLNNWIIQLPIKPFVRRWHFSSLVFDQGFFLGQPMQNNNFIRVLGYAGLLPFFIFLLMVSLLQSPIGDLALQGFVLYSLAILCFLAGTVWGRTQTIDQTLMRNLLVSNILVLFSVSSVLLSTDWLALILLPFGYMAILWYERRDALLPYWYSLMRLKLTLGVVLAHSLLLLLLFDQIGT